jgi:hypothetical protein
MHTVMSKDKEKKPIVIEAYVDPFEPMLTAKS